MQLSIIVSRWFSRSLSLAGLGRNASKEPTNVAKVIFTLPDGRKLTMEELQGVTGRASFHDGKLLDVTGTVRYEVIGTSTVPAEARLLHQQAREVGGGAAITRKPSRSWSEHRNARRSGLTPYMTERTLT